MHEPSVSSHLGSLVGLDLSPKISIQAAGPLRPSSVATPAATLTGQSESPKQESAAPP